MAEKAKQRLHAIGTQLAPAVVEDETFEDVPPIKQVGPVSNGPRAQGKVVIITGTLPTYWHSTIVVMATVSLEDAIISLTSNPNPRRKLAPGNRKGYGPSICPERRKGSLHL